MPPDVAGNIVRLNWMASMTALLGSQEREKEWLLSTRPAVGVPGEPLLQARARAHLQAARHAFVKEHPGPDPPASTVAYGLRGRHMSRKGKGKNANVAGVAIDYQAYANQLLTDPSITLLLETVGKGPTHHEFQDARGEELGYGARRALIREAGEETALDDSSLEWGPARSRTLRCSLSSVADVPGWWPRTAARSNFGRLIWTGRCRWTTGLVRSGSTCWAWAARVRWTA